MISNTDLSDHQRTIILALLALLVLVIAAILVPVLRDHPRDDEHHGWEDDTDTLDAILDATHADETEPRTLAANWPDLIEPPPVPQFDVERAYRGRHRDDDTVEIVLADWQPLIGARRNAAMLGETEQFAAVAA